MMTTKPDRVRQRFLFRMARCTGIAALALAVLAPVQLHAGGMHMGMHYIIKVTPSLVYLDAGSDFGTIVGQEFLVLREQEGDDYFMQVGNVRVLRVSEAFAIAEIMDVAEGEAVEVLHRVISRAAWDDMTAAALARGTEPETMVVQFGERSPMRTGFRRSVMVFGGVDINKASDLRIGNMGIIGGGDVTGGSAGLRLSRVVHPHWRLALSYRASGEPFGGDADVTQLSVEFDAHRLVRGQGNVGLYLGVGMGIHQLSWDVGHRLNETSYKTGLNAVAGLEIPLDHGGWSLIAEGGYQLVTEWNDVLDISHMRAYTGLSRNY